MQFSGGSCYQIEIPKMDATYTGTGDLFAALFLAWSYKTNNDIKLTLEKTIATLQGIVKDTYQKARGKLIVKMTKNISRRRITYLTITILCFSLFDLVFFIVTRSGCLLQYYSALVIIDNY